MTSNAKKDLEAAAELHRSGRKKEALSVNLRHLKVRPDDLFRGCVRERCCILRRLVTEQAEWGTNSWNGSNQPGTCTVLGGVIWLHKLSRRLWVCSRVTLEHGQNTEAYSCFSVDWKKPKRLPVTHFDLTQRLAENYSSIRITQ